MVDARLLLSGSQSGQRKRSWISRAGRSLICFSMLGLGGLTACATPPDPPPPPSGARVAETVSRSFVHCLAQAGGMCVDPKANKRSWNALSILIWLYEGSPPGILQGLQSELDRHSDSHAVEVRIVQNATRLRERIRGAECKPGGVMKMEELLEALKPRALRRMNTLGFGKDAMAPVVDRLAQEAGDGLAGGHLVYMRCGGDLHHLWLGTSVSGDTQVVAGIRGQLSPGLGGHLLPDDEVERRLASQEGKATDEMAIGREGLVDPGWVLLTVEEF